MKPIRSMLPILAFLFLVSCGGSPSTSSPASTPVPDSVPVALFGANMPWENLSEHSITSGELIRDRSFRINSTGLIDIFGKPVANLWLEYANGGTLSFSNSGGDNPVGEKAYSGHAQISRSSSGFSGIHQFLLDSVSAGDTLMLTFSSFGVGQSTFLAFNLFDSANAAVPISCTAPCSAAAVGYANSGNSAWQRHTVDLKITASAASAGLALYLYHDGAIGTQTVRLDEVRLAAKNASPQVKPPVSLAIAQLGIKSLRWPGGTLIDFFNWKDAIGPLAARGEVKASNAYQTPSFGLHEFLDYCEANAITPVLQVNFLNGASEAADLAEYVLGSSATPQGAVRTANGRVLPWNVSIFEIGNEPADSYKGSGSTENAALAYAAAAKPVIAAIKSKAAELGKTVKVSGIIEATFQLADWLAPVAANPDPAYAIVRLIQNWNSHALGSSGIGNVDFLDGHFYSYGKFDLAMTEAQAFPYVMAGGAVLGKTLQDKIKPLSTLPVWITEFNIYPKEDNTDIVHTERMMDFQSGLAIGDILDSLISLKIAGAQIHNLSQPWFGLIQNPDSGRLRPSGFVFQLFSAMAGEERIKVTTDNTETVTIGAGSGSVPGGLVYPLISATATKTTSGKTRIILINRSYTQTKQVALSFDTPVSGSADIYRYENNDLAAHNEGNTPAVAITKTTAIFGVPFKITLQPHSIVRIDMQ